jgi:hypothetical protein
MSIIWSIHSFPPSIDRPRASRKIIYATEPSVALQNAKSDDHKS